MCQAFDTNLHTFDCATAMLARYISCRNFVCPSVCRDKTKQCTADILIPYEKAITLVFWRQQWLVGSAPFNLKFALKVTHTLRKTPTSTHFRL